MPLTTEDLLITEYVVLSQFAPVESAERLFRHCFFIPIFADDKYVGLLTPKDLTQVKKTLVGDCLVSKPKILISDSVNRVVQKMIDSGYHALPCFDDYGTFKGVITVERAVELMGHVLAVDLIPVTINNVVGDQQAEESKASFLSEVSHHTKNPIQIILSAMNLLLHQQQLTPEQQELVVPAVQAALRLDAVISKLSMKYLCSMNSLNRMEKPNSDTMNPNA